MQRQIIFWLVALALTLLFFWYLQDILLPFIAGFVLAYFLDPLADKLEARGIPRTAATAIITLSALFLLALGVVFVVPVLGQQIGRLITDFPTLTKQVVDFVNLNAPDWLRAMLPENGGDLQTTLSTYGDKLLGWVVSLGSTLLSGGKSLINLFSLLIITPIVAFYILNDWDRIVAIVDGYLPRNEQESIRAIARDVDKALAGYIRGQGTLCLILAVFYGLSFLLAGLKSGLAIGLMTGLLTFIPFFGALTGGATALGVGALQFGLFDAHLLGVVAVLALGQFLEGYVLSPKLVGHSIGLHPVWMMLAILAFAYVFGIMGLLLAVPLAATTGVLVRHGLARYLSSEIYLGPTKKAK
jgi:predicted PurR-regulated permease PerM